MIYQSGFSFACVVSILLLHALVFIVETVVGTMTGIVRKKIAHVVLVQGDQAHVCVPIRVIIIKLAALTAALYFLARICQWGSPRFLLLLYHACVKVSTLA